MAVLPKIQADSQVLCDFVIPFAWGFAGLGLVLVPTLHVFDAVHHGPVGSEIVVDSSLAQELG